MAAVASAVIDLGPRRAGDDRESLVDLLDEIVET